MTNAHPETERVRVPADVEREDRLLAGLTARQLALLSGPAVLLWIAYLALQDRVPPVVFAAVAAPVVVAALTVALGRRDGMGLDRLLLAAWRQHRFPRRLVPAPDGVRPAPRWAGSAEPLPAALDLPVEGVAGDGTIGLGAEGAALLCRASTVNLALRTPGEQEALVAVFARFLNSLSAPIQILIRSEPTDLSEAIEDLRNNAGGLPHPALEACALAHAGYLADLAGRHDLLRREILVVLRDPGTDAGAAGRLHRRATDMAGTLAGAGIAVTVLEGPAAGAALAAATNPWNQRRSGSLAVGNDEPVTGVGS